MAGYMRKEWVHEWESRTMRKFQSPLFVFINFCWFCVFFFSFPFVLID